MSMPTRIHKIKQKSQFCPFYNLSILANDDMAIPACSFASSAMAMSSLGAQPPPQAVNADRPLPVADKSIFGSIYSKF